MLKVMRENMRQGKCKGDDIQGYEAVQSYTNKRCTCLIFGTIGQIMTLQRKDFDYFLFVWYLAVKS